MDSYAITAAVPAPMVLGQAGTTCIGGGSLAGTGRSLCCRIGDRGDTSRVWQFPGGTRWCVVTRVAALLSCREHQPHDLVGVVTNGEQIKVGEGDLALGGEAMAHPVEQSTPELTVEEDHRAHVQFSGLD